MSERRRCFFIGHRDAPDSVYPALLETVREHITCRGVTEFIEGRYGNFDVLAARAVLEEKIRHPEVILTLLLAYHPAERKILLPRGFDGSWYPPKMETVPRHAAIARANRCAVNYAGYLIAYVRHPASNAGMLTEYARKRVALTEL